MLGALHKKTYEETGSAIQSAYFGYQIWDKFKDPYSEEWLCCPICKKPVSPVKKHVRNYNDKEINVISHFRNRSNDGCISTESDEHKNAKILLSSLIENNKIKLKIKTSFINFNELKYKEVPRLPFRWEQKRENRRADVLFEFINWHNVLGQGLVFEIQNYDLDELSTQKRETDWIQNGYSLAWVPLSLFTDESLVTTELSVDCVWAIRYLETMRRLKEELSTLFYSIKNEMAKYEDRRNKTCRTCIQGSKDRGDPSLIACWYGTKWGRTDDAIGFMRRPSKHEALDTCSHWCARVRVLTETEDTPQIEV